jgi:foldase protein PrsA
MRSGMHRERHRFGIRRAIVVTGLCALLAVGPAACGSSGDGPTVAHVGRLTIGRDAVAHWAHVLGQGASIEGLQDERHGTPTQRALGLLIDAQWINGEASRQGVAPSSDSVSKAVTGRKEANGASEFEAALHASGQTVGDVELEVRTELAAAAIGHKLAKQAEQTTEAEVMSYYEQHPRAFTEPEERQTELIENLPSPAAATALVRRIGTGHAFKKRAIKEAVVRAASGAASPGDIPNLSDAIFAAAQGVVSRPTKLNRTWTVFIVRKIVPAKLKPLASVRRQATSQLIAQRHQQLFASFERGYRARWRARTSCKAGYVVPRCVQYGGPQLAEESPFPSE